MSVKVEQAVSDVFQKLCSADQGIARAWLNSLEPNSADFPTTRAALDHAASVFRKMRDGRMQTILEGVKKGYGEECVSRIFTVLASLRLRCRPEESHDQIYPLAVAAACGSRNSGTQNKSELEELLVIRQDLEAHIHEDYIGDFFILSATYFLDRAPTDQPAVHVVG